MPLDKFQSLISNILATTGVPFNECLGVNEMKLIFCMLGLAGQGNLNYRNQRVVGKKCGFMSGFDDRTTFKECELKLY